MLTSVAAEPLQPRCRFWGLPSPLWAKALQRRRNILGTAQRLKRKYTWFGSILALGLALVTFDWLFSNEPQRNSVSNLFSLVCQADLHRRDTSRTSRKVSSSQPFLKSLVQRLLSDKREGISSLENRSKGHVRRWT
jgi:hypothetical protein